MCSKYIDRSVPPHNTLPQTKKYLQNMIDSSNNGRSDFVIVLVSASAPPTVIGKAGIWLVGTGEVGFMLNRAYWGKGYMTEALQNLLDHLWSGKGGDVPYLTADVDPRNDASINILKRFGFQETGYQEKTIKTHLGWCDSIYLTLKNPNTKSD